MTVQAEVVVIGAGPCGLFQVFELGLQGIKAHVVEALAEPGGQCMALYPDKPIFDIPAIPECSARQLVERLMQQIRPFAPEFHLGQQATEISRQTDGRFLLRTSGGLEFDTAAIIVAGGVGSFQPVPLKVEGVDTFEGQQLFYSITDVSQHAGKDLVLLGGGDAAFDWVLELADKANSLTMVHRSTQFRASAASVQAMQELCDAGRMRFVQGRVTGFDAADGVLQAVQVSSGDEVIERLPLDHLLVFFGLSPKLGPIAKWGLNLDRNLIEVDTEKFQTSVPGIYAVGDINVYPGKRKLILSGFHEAALAAFAIKSQLSPGEKVHLMYTTTSPLIHERLGVHPKD